MPTDHLAASATWPVDDGLVRSWARDHHESGAYAQARLTAQVKKAERPVALMPDAHVGKGACIGSVVATEGAIVPACVGVDLGCGVSAVRLNCGASDLPDDLRPALGALAAAAPRSEHGGHGRIAHNARVLSQRLGDAPSGMADMGRAARQLGTLGGGNHFLEVSLDVGGRAWLVVHSGSRGVGNFLARQHIGVAARADAEAPGRDLAALYEGSDEFASYVGDMHWSQEYAHLNRELMLERAVTAFGRAAGLDPDHCAVVDRVRCHHNYAEMEEHAGRMLWITRKGAIRARRGDRGIVPGSMGASTFLVEGLGNPDSYCSAAHGAGRAMSRRRAKDTLSLADMDAQMADRVWMSHRAEALLDEAPGAYKDIRAVMEWQSDLCRATDELTAIVNYKGI